MGSGWRERKVSKFFKLQRKYSHDVWNALDFVLRNIEAGALEAIVDDYEEWLKENSGDREDEE